MSPSYRGYFGYLCSIGDLAERRIDQGGTSTFVNKKGIVFDLAQCNVTRAKQPINNCQGQPKNHRAELVRRIIANLFVEKLEPGSAFFRIRYSRRTNNRGDRGWIIHLIQLRCHSFTIFTSYRERCISLKQQESSTLRSQH